jgi:hypothetical protein
VSGVVLDANAVAQVITYVAPGFMARLGYRARYPGPDTPPGEVLIISVVTSLPLVAFVRWVLPGTQKATEVGYVACLLALGLLLGYFIAFIRGRERTKNLLAILDYHIQPEGTIYAGLLRHMGDDATVTVERKDGRLIWGCPRRGPQHKGDGVAELYLVYPKELGENGERVSLGAGVIVPLTEVSAIYLSEDPTGAPAEEVEEAAPEDLTAAAGAVP